MRLVFLASCLGLMLGGCVSIHHLPAQLHFQKEGLQKQFYRSPDSKKASEPPLITLYPAQTTDRYETMRLKFPSIGENRQTENKAIFRYLKSRMPGPKKILIIIPPFETYTIPTDLISYSFTEGSGENDYEVLILERDKDFFDWEFLARAGTSAEFLSEIELGVARIEATVTDVQRAMQWIASYGQRGAPIIVGISMGSLISSLITQSYGAEVSAAFFIFGGGDPHTVFSETLESNLSGIRTHATTTFGWTRDQYEQKLHEKFDRINPIRYQSNLPPNRILMFEAENDTYVPYLARKRFWEALGRPERIIYSADHKISFVAGLFGPNTFVDAMKKFLKQNGL